MLGSVETGYGGVLGCSPGPGSKLRYRSFRLDACTEVEILHTLYSLQKVVFRSHRERTNWAFVTA
jgi:hypothetical protein